MDNPAIRQARRKPRTTRATARAIHEHHLGEAIDQLTHAAHFAANPTSELVTTLDAALLTLVRAHHGRRNVRRTNQRTSRELHRRTIDRLLQASYQLTDTCAELTTAALPSEDREDVLVHLEWIHRTLDKIGYR